MNNLNDVLLGLVYKSCMNMSQYEQKILMNSAIQAINESVMPSKINEAESKADNASTTKLIGAGQPTEGNSSFVKDNRVITWLTNLPDNTKNSDIDTILTILTLIIYFDNKDKKDDQDTLYKNNQQVYLDAINRIFNTNLQPDSEIANQLVAAVKQDKIEVSKDVKMELTIKPKAGAAAVIPKNNIEAPAVNNASKLIAAAPDQLKLAAGNTQDEKEKPENTRNPGVVRFKRVDINTKLPDDKYNELPVKGGADNLRGQAVYDTIRMFVKGGIDWKRNEKTTTTDPKAYMYFDKSKQMLRFVDGTNKMEVLQFRTNMKKESKTDGLLIKILNESKKFQPFEGTISTNPANAKNNTSPTDLVRILKAIEGHGMLQNSYFKYISRDKLTVENKTKIDKDAIVLIYNSLKTTPGIVLYLWID